ncbi:DNA circularization N-terminal domain-containing protein [uncultured Hyphomicrobium sp.]|uniref:DNA circularization N-terminal domain-containing protein n=1 Tax=uncultured Hyphomicrobium sp. TaxID=194373 RepID=UPI0025F1A447|nr:DNA circularization N-terminal domain-containing protein [uncultured Hyphomicrobium sp.]
MECHVDWVKTLRKASFRGAHFWVETDSIAYGRRIETHEFPNRDRPYQEDLGEKAIEFNVTAYVASDNLLSEKAALVNACRRRGAGTLVLPTEGSQRVVVFSCERTHDRDKLGYIAFDIHFGEAGTSMGIGVTAVLSRLVGIAVGGAIPALRSDFLRTYNVVDEASWVLPAAVNTVKAVLAAIDDTRLGTQMKPEGNTAIAATIAAAYENAQALAYDGAGIRPPKQSAIDVRGSSVSGKIVQVMADLIADVRLQSINANEAIEALGTIASIETQGSGAGLGITAQVEKGNDLAIGSLVRRLALMELAVAGSEADFTDRRVAIRVRAQMAQGFEREMASATGELYQRLDEIRGRAADAISQKIASIRPTITVEGNASEPSLTWAYRLYADATREVDLRTRNRVRHPAFMPPSFQAEAPEIVDVPQRLP